MNSSFIESIIRKLNRRTLILSLIGLMLVMLGIALGGRYLINMVLGPANISRAELLAVQDPSSVLRYFVIVGGDDHVDTGYSYVNVSDSGKETVEAYYHALLVGERLLLVKSKDVEIGNSVKGALEQIPSDVQTQVIGELENEYPDLVGAFLPIMLDATNFYTNGLIGLAVAAVFGLLSVWGLGLALYRFANPEAHPAMKALERFGAPNLIAGEIDIEMAGEHQKVGKNVYFTRRWLIDTITSLNVVPYRNIVWCYKRVTQHRTNGIPTGKTYAAHVMDRHGKEIIIGGKEADVDQVLKNIATATPNTIVGYSEELNQFWRKDRAKFIAAVDERRNNARN